MEKAWRFAPPEIDLPATHDVAVKRVEDTLMGQLKGIVDDFQRFRLLLLFRFAVALSLSDAPLGTL